MQAAKFDIVWFTNENAEEAMHSLLLLPESEFSERRGKAHPFRTWIGCPTPDKDGNNIGPMQCVCVDFQGSALLNPGEIDERHCKIAEKCSEIIVVKPGFVGAWTKPEFWEDEHVKAEAAIQERDEQKGKEDGQKLRQEYAETFAKERSGAIRRYFMAIACGRRLSWRTPSSALQDIVMIDRIEDELQREVTIDEWLAVIHPGNPMPEKEPYDRMKFLQDVGRMRAQAVRTHNITGNAGKYLDRLFKSGAA